MLNYAVDRSLLNDYVPPGTVLDSFEDRTYLSLVGFRFCRVKLFGYLPIPFHTDFDEVNLRFYVRRKEGSEYRRGVVFIAEIVPKLAVAKVARVAFGENYSCLPMRHRVYAEGSKEIEYEWRVNGRWCKLFAEALSAPTYPKDGSLEQFITEHYWGYANQRGRCLQYQVAHVPWRVSASTASGFEGDTRGLYGRRLGDVLQGLPDSAFIADGSPVIVFRGKRIS